MILFSSIDIIYIRKNVLGNCIKIAKKDKTTYFISEDESILKIEDELPEDEDQSIGN